MNWLVCCIWMWCLLNASCMGDCVRGTSQRSQSVCEWLAGLLNKVSRPFCRTAGGLAASKSLCLKRWIFFRKFRDKPQQHCDRILAAQPLDPLVWNSRHCESTIEWHNMTQIKWFFSPQKESISSIRRTQVQLESLNIIRENIRGNFAIYLQVFGKPRFNS